MTLYFLLAVYDPGEWELARKSSSKAISYWKRRGVRYLNIVDEQDYNQQLKEYGEIVQKY